MFSPVEDAVANVLGVQSILGSPVRVYSFGNAPQDVAKPYAVHQVVGGSPENYLGNAPDIDNLSVQIDVYDDQAPRSKIAARALVAALEVVGYITSWNGEFRELDTKLFRISFTVEFKTPR